MPGGESWRSKGGGPASSVAMTCVGASAKTPSTDKERAWPTLGSFCADSGYSEVVSTPTRSALACKAKTISVSAPPTLTMRRALAARADNPVGHAARSPHCRHVLRRSASIGSALAEWLMRRICGGPGGGFRFWGRHRTGYGGFLDDPGAGNVVFPKMQAESGIEHIQPRPHDSHLFDRPGVNLNHAGIADKHHDGHAIGRRRMQQALAIIRRHFVDIPGFGQAQGLRSCQAKGLEQSEELMCIAQRVPCPMKTCHIDGCIREFGWPRRRGLCADACALIAGGKVGHQARIGRHIAAWFQKDFVDGRAFGIKELKAALLCWFCWFCWLSWLRLLDDSKAMCPLPIEDAQIDRAAQHQSHMVLVACVAIDPGLFMHA